MNCWEWYIIQQCILKANMWLGPIVIGKAKSFYDEMKITDKCTFSEGSNKQNKQCTCNLTLWCICITTVALEIQLLHSTIVELHATVNYIKIISVVQQCFWHIYVAGSNKIYIGLHVSAWHFCLILTKLGFFGQIFVNVPSVNVHTKPSSWSRTGVYGHMDRHGKSISAFCYLCKCA
jgi:hypothetical protein